MSQGTTQELAAKQIGVSPQTLIPEMLSGVIACRSVELARCWINLAVRSVGCVMFPTTSHV